jgi:hypothetical protein
MLKNSHRDDKILGFSAESEGVRVITQKLYLTVNPNQETSVTKPFCTDSQSPNKNYRLRHPKSGTKASQTIDLATEKRRVTTTNSSSYYH